MRIMNHIFEEQSDLALPHVRVQLKLHLIHE